MPYNTLASFAERILFQQAQADFAKYIQSVIAGIIILDIENFLITKVEYKDEEVKIKMYAVQTWISYPMQTRGISILSI